MDNKLFFFNDNHGINIATYTKLNSLLQMTLM